MIGAGGVIQASPDNLTLYNLGVSMRLLGGSTPRDILLDQNRRPISFYSFWAVEGQVGSLWIPLRPTTSQFRVMGTNRTGTVVMRTMNVTSSAFSGVFRIVYKATSAGALKWDLDFRSASSGHFRFTFEWNVTNTHQLFSPTRQFTVGYGLANYTLSWNDVPSYLNTTTTVSPNQFALSIDLGNLVAGSRATIDPSIISSNVAAGSTAYTFQRRVFYEPKGGYYWAFYYNGGSISYGYSANGTTWSPRFFTPNLTPDSDCCDAWVYLPGLYYVGQTVIIAAGHENGTFTGTASVALHYSIGTISSSTINWGPVLTADTLSRTCGSGTCKMGIRYVGVTLSSSGLPAFSYNYYTSGSGVGVCTSSTVTSESGIFMNYSGTRVRNSCNSGSGGFDSEQDRSVILPSNSQGQVRVIYQFHSGSAIQINARWMDGLGYAGQIETVETNTLGNEEFSATVDSNYNDHLVYRGTNGNVTYAFRPILSSSWINSRNIFQGSVGFPTITADLSTGDVYAFAISGTSIEMRRKSLAGSWFDSSTSFPVTQRVNPTNLGSNLASASATNSSYILLVWTEGVNVFNATFASIPIQTVWSPYSSPTDPWDGGGLAPYGQYFANLGEDISPFTGILTVKQTDLSIPGRGLSLEITRVYTEPYSFLGSQPYNYEKYQWAPMGDGWQLNFPWMNSTNHPNYVHLWDGDGYRIPSSFWSGLSATLDNHQGENFRLVRYLNNSITLYTKTGASYDFDNSTRKLSMISDSTGNSTITFYYNNGRISCISDTTQRAFSFVYSGGLLQSVAQANGSCTNLGSNIRVVYYGNNGQSLTSMTDPANRITRYSYNATANSSIAPWLLARVTYPTNGYSNYTYATSTMGTTAVSYRVNKQYVGVLTAPRIREFDYKYQNGAGDQVNNSTVTTYNQTAIVSFNSYSFAFSGIVWNISDPSHKFVRGEVQRFGVHGEIPREAILVSPTQSITNYKRYDLWGNLIYSRNAINETVNQYHESFNAYYNDALLPGFYAFQDTFSQEQGTASDNSWKVYNGTWIVQDGVVNGTSPVANPPNQNFFAWQDVGLSDLSLQASVYITKSMSSSDQRVGLVAHYPGTGTNKWGLVLHNSANNIKLSLLDDNIGWVVESPCNLLYSTWYTLNFTIHGSAASGWASAPGISTCYVSGTFPSDNVGTSTGFGLYAGGYSALFDNVVVATVSPYITGTGFSNSFVQSGAPGPTGLNTWLVTTRPPGLGWNTTSNFDWLPAAGWNVAPPAQDFYGGAIWTSQTLSNWPDKQAQWIWATAGANVSASADPVWFRRIFTVPSTSTINFTATADNNFVLYVDGNRCSVGTDWTKPKSCTVSLSPGTYHILAVNATNPDGKTPSHPNQDPGGFLLTALANGKVLLHTDGVAGPILPALAASAQLQNGPGSHSMETYYSYYPWGGLNQTRQLYDNPRRSASSQTNPQTSATSTLADAGFGDSWSRQTFYSTGRYWAFYTTTIANCEVAITTACLQYATSTDGASWESYNLNKIAYSSTNLGVFSIAHSGNSVYYARANASSAGPVYNIVFRSGTLNPNGTISWNMESKVLSTSPYNYYSLSLAISTTGLAFIGYTSPSPNYGTSVIRSTDTTYSQWTEYTNLCFSCSTGSALVAMTGGKVYDVFYTYADSLVLGKVWDNSWPGGPAETVCYCIGQDLSLVANGDTITSFLQSAASILDIQRPASTSTWNSPDTIVSAGLCGSSTSPSCISASFDPSYNNYYLFYYNQVGRLINYYQGMPGKWSPSIQLLSTGAADSNNGVTSSLYSEPGGTTNILLAWTEKTASPYNIKLTSISPSAQWFASTTTYDGKFGNTKTYTDYMGNITRFDYSTTYNNAYLTNLTRTLGGSPATAVTTLYAYNFTTGNQVSVTDPMKNATSYQNDALGRTTKVTYSTGDFVSYAYNDTSNYVVITNENGTKVKQSYDGLSRLVRVDRFLNGATYSSDTTTYNWMNSVANQTDALQHTYKYQYDVLGRLLNVTKPDGTVARQFYNDVAGWVRSTDEYGKYRCSVYDRMGRLVQVVENAASNCQPGIITSYSYNEIGELTTMTNANGASTTDYYDNLGRLTTISYADGTTQTYTLDKNGKIIASTDQKAVKTLSSYDSLDRLQTVTFCGSHVTSTSYTYDRNGNVVTLQNQNATITYTYDKRDRALTEKYDVNLASRKVVDLGCNGNGGTSTTSGGSQKTYTVSYSYKGEFLDTVPYPTIIAANIAVKYSYDALGRVLSVKNGATGAYFASSFTYLNDQLKGLQYGNGLIQNYTYDAVSRMSNVTLRNGGSTLLTLAYGYNATGTVASVTGVVNGATVNEQYRYDPLQRITNSTVKSQGTTNTIWYTYDYTGNRLTQSINRTLTSYGYNNANNELTSSSAPGTSSSYSYDNNGNVATRTSGAVTWTYTWDGANHLLKVASNGAAQGSYAYDGMGRRVESIECACSDIWFYAYRGSETLWQTDANWGSIDFVSASGMKIATLDSSVGGCYCTVKYYHLDALGSTRLVTSPSKSITFTDGYQPFGQDNGTPNSSENYKFTGKPYSTSVGLYYEYQRWYDPSIGRFISADPVSGSLNNPQSLNPYVYSANVPTTLTDPTGMFLYTGPDVLYRPDRFEGAFFLILGLGGLEFHHNLNGAIGIEDYNPCLTLRCLGGLATGILGLLGLADLLGSGGQGTPGPSISCTEPVDCTDPGLNHKTGSGSGSPPTPTPFPAGNPTPTGSSTPTSPVGPSNFIPRSAGLTSSSIGSEGLTNFKWLPKEYTNVKGLRGNAGWVCLGVATAAYGFWAFYGAPQSAIRGGLEYNLTPDQGVVAGDVLLMALLGCAGLHAWVN